MRSSFFLQETAMMSRLLPQSEQHKVKTSLSWTIGKLAMPDHVRNASAERLQILQVERNDCQIGDILAKAVASLAYR